MLFPVFLGCSGRDSTRGQMLGLGLDNLHKVRLD